MDLNFTREEQAFRAQVRAFVDAHLPADIRERVLSGKRLGKDDFMTWHKLLYRQGWVAPNWPVEFGGTGWSPVQQHIFNEECADAGAPGLLPFGLVMVAPVIMAFGSPAQQQYFLPKILSGEHWWCQGYSEPGAGSDLAGLKTRAERVGDKYIVNGQKTWTTLGQFADWIFCLVRTSPDARKQEGISFLLIDMKTPGIQVRPIILLDGEHEVNEVWFDNVEVPVENRVGEENKGWTYAKFLLGHERTGIAEVGRSKRWLKRLKEIARRQRGSDGKPLIEDVRFRDRIAQVEVELMALEITNLRVIAAEMEKRAPGPEASLLKIRGSEIQQTLSELLMQALGPEALPFQEAALHAGYDGAIAGPEYGAALPGQYFNMRKTTIYGGSNEIQKNIISKMILGF
ncbi:MAG TPA: acyl-CoA dehydrogenase family protein [Solimonas sp.]